MDFVHPQYTLRGAWGRGAWGGANHFWISQVTVGRLTPGVWKTILGFKGMPIESHDF